MRHSIQIKTKQTGILVSTTRLLLPAALLLCIVASIHAAQWEEGDYWVDSEGLHVNGVELVNGNILENPIVYDNDGIDDVIDIQYLLCKASLGEANLVGLVGCPIGPDHPTFCESCYNNQWPVMYQMCVDSNMCMDRIPQPVRGSTHYIHNPGNGVIDDTNPEITDGSTRYVEQARMTTPDKPLLSFIGGMGTTMANAYIQSLKDGGPPIDDRVIVYYTDGSGYNGSDKWASHIVTKRLRTVNIGRTFWFNQSCKSSQCQWTVLPTPSGCAVNEWAQFPDNQLAQSVLNTLQHNFHYTGQLDCCWDGPLDGFWVGIWAPKWFANGVNRFNVSWNGNNNWSGTSNLPCNVIDQLQMPYDGERQAHDELLYVWTSPDTYDGQCPASIEAPTNVNVSAPTVDSVQLSWQDNSSDPQEDGFTIERKPYHGQNQWHAVGSVGQNVTDFTDTDSLYGNVIYTYRVGAYKQ